MDKLKTFLKKIIFIFCIIGTQFPSTGFHFAIDVFHNSIGAFANIHNLNMVQSLSKALIAAEHNIKELKDLAEKEKTESKKGMLDFKVSTNYSIGAAGMFEYGWDRYFAGLDLRVMPFGFWDEKINYKFDFQGKYNNNLNYLTALKKYSNYVYSESDLNLANDDYLKGENANYNGNIQLIRDPLLTASIYFGTHLTKRLKVSAGIGGAMLDSQIKISCITEKMVDIKQDEVYKLPRSFGVNGNLRIAFDLTNFWSVFASVGGVFFLSKPYVINNVDVPVYSVAQPNLLFVQFGVTTMI